MRKILVPTDFSECASNAVQVALEIAKRAKAEIIFQHVFPDISGSLHTLKPALQNVEHQQQNAALGQAKASLDALVRQAEQAGLTTQPLLVMDRGSDKIENYIDAMNIDLVIMGSHGITGIRELILGSQTQRVVRYATVPVLVIKHRPDALSFSNIMFTSTFHENPATLLHIPVILARLWNGTIHLLYIGLEKDHQTKDEVEEKMRHLEAQFPHTDFTRNFITTNDPEWGIKHVATDITPDVIAITTQLKTGALLFSHSLAEKLVNHEFLPVLVLNQ
jgi:nucleotide-binding universal stress UspA family protein